MKNKLFKHTVIMTVVNLIMRSVSVVVFPEPAAAETSRVRSRVSIADSCSGENVLAIFYSLRLNVKLLNRLYGKSFLELAHLSERKEALVVKKAESFAHLCRKGNFFEIYLNTASCKSCKKG